MHFEIVPRDVVHHFERHFGVGEIHGAAMIIDWKFFFEHQEVIEAWCDENAPGWMRDGVLFGFKTEKDALLFKLRWC